MSCDVVQETFNKHSINIFRCKTCGEYIYKGKKFNAKKEDVENDTYLGIRIYRFYIKCTRCLSEISFKTDPQNTDYEIEAGATRNFEALKKAEEQAVREEQAIKEEEANNPMKLLESRTEQSRNEIELLESLEELKDLRKRQEDIDYTEMLQQYEPNDETLEEREAREAKADEDLVKSIKFHNQSGTKRIVAEEIIEEVEDIPEKKARIDTEFARPQQQTSKLITTKKPLVLVKKKPPPVEQKPAASALALVSAYSDSDSD